MSFSKIVFVEISKDTENGKPKEKALLLRWYYNVEIVTGKYNIF
jgi:hypothetical protein